MHRSYARILAAMPSIESVAGDYTIAMQIPCHYATNMNKKIDRYSGILF